MKFYFLSILALIILQSFAKDNMDQSLFGNGEIIITEKSESITLYKDIRQKLNINVVDLNVPCSKRGSVMLSSEGCRISKLSDGWFYVQPFRDNVIISVIYESEGAFIHVSDLRVRCITAPVNEAEFKAAYPGKDIFNIIGNNDNTDLGSVSLRKNDHYKVDMPAPVLSGLTIGKQVRIEANFLDNCNPLPLLDIEGEGVQIEKTPFRNEFLLTPTQNEVHIKVFNISAGLHDLIDEKNYIANGVSR